MSCPRCGEVCRCPETSDAPEYLHRPPRLDPESLASPSAIVLIDPEAADDTELRFSASLEAKGEPSAPRFVVETSEDDSCGGERDTAHSLSADQAKNRIQLAEDRTEPIGAAGQTAAIAFEPDANAPSNPSEDGKEGAWRDEVAARLNSYRSRRRSRAPKYPSLRLKFEAPPENPEASQTFVADHFSPSTAATARAIRPAPEAVPGESAKIIPFPRSGHAPPIRLDELADPVFDRPRIVEVPEAAPPPPALGGILIEPVEQPQEERRPGIDVPLQSAPLAKRIFAAVADGVLVLGALVISAYVFYRLTGYAPTLPQGTGAFAITAGLFWITYQYLLLVYAGMTPGLWLAKLRLSRFDGNPARRPLRRWRVLASVLSGISLGLGYAWCFLDEDALCWHDRITRTYLAPKK